MRVFVREKIDIDKEIDLDVLKPLERIVVATRSAISKTSIFRDYKQKELDRELVHRMKTIEDLKLVLLYHLDRKLSSDNIKCAYIDVDRRYDEYLDETLNSIDFMSYDIKIMEENSDYLVAFPDLPILLKVGRKYG
ncbi:hypothetical protein D3C81_1245720 [compost metagenome]